MYLFSDKLKKLFLNRRNQWLFLGILFLFGVFFLWARGGFTLVIPLSFEDKIALQQLEKFGFWKTAILVPGYSLNILSVLQLQIIHWAGSGLESASTAIHYITYSFLAVGAVLCTWRQIRLRWSIILWAFILLIPRVDNLALGSISNTSNFTIFVGFYLLFALTFTEKIRKHVYITQIVLILLMASTSTMVVLLGIVGFLFEIGYFLYKDTYGEMNDTLLKNYFATFRNRCWGIAAASLGIVYIVSYYSTLTANRAQPLLILNPRLIKTAFQYYVISPFYKQFSLYFAIICFVAAAAFYIITFCVASLQWRKKLLWVGLLYSVFRVALILTRYRLLIPASYYYREPIHNLRYYNSSLYLLSLLPIIMLMACWIEKQLRIKNRMVVIAGRAVSVLIAAGIVIPGIFY